MKQYLFFKTKFLLKIQLSNKQIKILDNLFPFNIQI